MTNMIRRLQAGAMASAAILAASLIVTPTVAAQEQTINAHAAYIGEGKIYQTGENKGTFVGALIGQLYIESDKGPLNAGRIVCPGTMEIDLKNGKLTGGGRCTITARDGAQVFAAWSCRGVLMVGCKGKMMLTGGTGRTAGVSGGGPVTISSTASIMTKASSNDGAVERLGNGMLVLRGFKYKKPSK
jgi:hypothetical protein